MERAELAPQLELTHEVQPKIQEGTTHDKEEHVLALDDRNTSLTERIQPHDNDRQDHKSRRQRPRHHVDRQFVYKSRLYCYFYIFLHSHTERLSAQSLCQKNSRYIFRAPLCIRRRVVKEVKSRACPDSFLH